MFSGQTERFLTIEMESKFRRRKIVEKRKNILTSKYRRGFDVEISTAISRSKYCYVFQHFFDVELSTPFRRLIENARWVGYV